jgi:hypothetical protein
MSTFAYTAVTTSAYPSGSVTAPANTNTTL